MRKVIATLLVAVMTLGVFSGCSSKGSDKTYLRIAEDVDLPSMDQHIATDGLSFEVIAATIEGLYSTDAAGSLIPAIAESYVVSDDQLTYTFTLRDAKWSNGDAVTANDFVFGWRRLVDPATASEYSFIGEVAGIVNAAAVTKGEKKPEELGVVAKDDKTLVVTLDRPVPYFLSLTAFASFFPLNEKFFTAQAGQYAIEPKNLLANGPFKLTTWNKGYGFTLDKNETYYDVKNVTIDGLDYRVIKDNQTAALKYESKELDVVKLSAELVDKYKTNEAYQQIEAAYVWYVTPNNENPVFANVNVRKALQHAINKQHIVDKILNDGSTVADFIVPAGLATGPDGKDFRETAPNNYGVYDVAQAQKYWETAKTELGKTEVTVELLFDDSETVKKTAEFIQAELETNLPGIKVSLKAQPKKNRLELMTKGEYEVGLTRWGPDYADPLTYLELFLTGVTNNYPRYSNTTYDELVKSASTTLAADAAGRWQAMIDAEKLFLEDEAGIAPLYQSGYAFLINPKVTGIEPHAIGTPFIYKNVKIAK